VNHRDPTGRALPLLAPLYGAYVTYGFIATQAVCFGAGFIDESSGVDVCPITPADQLGRATKLAGRASVRAGGELLDASVAAISRSRASIIEQLRLRVRQLELAKDTARRQLDIGKGTIGVALEQAGKRVQNSLDKDIDLIVNAVNTSAKGPTAPPPVGNLNRFAQSIIKDQLNSATQQAVVDLRNLTREQAQEVKRLVSQALSDIPTKPIIYLE
jgi:hypothetical protein